MIEKIKEKFNRLKPEQKKLFQQIGGVAILILIAMASYKVSGRGNSSSSAKANQTKGEKGFREMTPQLHTLQRNLYLETKEKVSNLEKQLVIMNKNIKKMEDNQKFSQDGVAGELRLEVENLKNALAKSNEDLQKKLSAQAQENKSSQILSQQGGINKSSGGNESIPWTAPPTKDQRITAQKASKQAIATDFEAAPTVYQKGGEIKHFSGSPSKKKTDEKVQSGDKSTEAETNDKTKKKKVESVYLPSGTILKADLITGFAAKTLQGAESEPIKCIFRINAPAVLPSNYTSDLASCIILAEGTASLSDERTHIRMQTISCISRDGTSVIDNPIAGYAVDAGDGKIGLRGRVSAKFGATIGRAVVVGLFESLGTGIANSGYTTNDTILGTTQTLNRDLENIAKAGFGQGVANASKDVKDLFLKLAGETMPILESGAGKPANLVVTAGTTLTINGKCFDGRDGCFEKEGKNEEGSISALGNL